MTTRSHDAEVLFFTSPHCSLCAAVRPTVAEVASSFQESVGFREIDATTDRQATIRYRIKGVPTFITTRDDEELGRFVGPRSRDEITRMFTSARAGTRTRTTISRLDRTLRLGVAAAFAAAAVVASAPVLWVFAVGAAAFGVWDLVRP